MNEWELSPSVKLQIPKEELWLAGLWSCAKRIFAKGRAHIPVVVEYNALILSPPEIYAWKGEEQFSKGTGMPLRADRTSASVTRGVAIQLGCIIFCYKGAEEQMGSLSDFPRSSYRPLPHSLLPPQIFGSSRGWESLPRMLTHLHLVVILTIRLSNLNEFEDLRRGQWSLFSLYYGLLEWVPWTSITWISVRNACFQALPQTCWIRDSRCGAQESVLTNPLGDSEAG